jgi:hypothetical protein
LRQRAQTLELERLVGDLRSRLIPDPVVGGNEPDDHAPRPVFDLYVRDDVRRSHWPPVDIDAKPCP